MKTPSRSDCPLVFALDLFGDRWALLIIRDLLQGKQHFDKFLSSPEGVASNILADGLKPLTKLGFVKRFCDKQDKHHFLYRLTPLGKSTRQFLLPMIRWSSVYTRKSHKACCG